MLLLQKLVSLNKQQRDKKKLYIYNYIYSIIIRNKYLKKKIIPVFSCTEYRCWARLSFPKKSKYYTFARTFITAITWYEYRQRCASAVTRILSKLKRHPNALRSTERDRFVNARVKHSTARRNDAENIPY